MIPDVLRSDLKDFGQLFRLYARRALMTTHGVPDDYVGRLIIEGPDGFAKTDSRAVLGSMNEYIWMCKAHIYDDGGLVNKNIDEINQYLNRIPMGTLRYKNSSERLIEVLT